MKYAFDVTICSEADKVIFDKQCKALENRIPRIEKGEYVIDVDESEIQHYSLEGKDIAVFNNYFINAVYIKSQIDLLPFFQKN